MDLRADDSITATPGDFASRVVNGDLYVPVAIAEFARLQHLSTADELAGFIDAFPSTVAQSLGWRTQAVIAASARLQEQLTRAGYRTRRESPKRVYGFG